LAEVRAVPEVPAVAQGVRLAVGVDRVEVDPAAEVRAVAGVDSAAADLGEEGVVELADGPVIALP